MEHILKYSVLRYSPSRVSGEKINLGILFSDENRGLHQFKYSKNFKRLKNFDDEVSIELVKKTLDGISLDVNNSLFKDDSFSIYNYIKFYINSFSFDEPKAIYYEDWDTIIEEINKSYFRFDYEKSKRPSKQDDLNLLGRIIFSSENNVKKNVRCLGEFSENLTYDYYCDSYKVKFFDFDERQLSRLVNTAKTWAFNSLADKEKNLIIIYRYSNEKEKDGEAFDTIKKIFAFSNTTFLNFEQGIDYLKHLTS